MRLFLLALAATLAWWPMSSPAQTALWMAEEPGCFWCARWNREIAEIYPKTPEGRAAPLQRFDLGNGPPEDITFAQPVRFTPTFILTVDGAEVSRIEGYPGEDFFWGLLGQMLDRIGPAPGGTG